ncbi:flagellar M-ring protein FliF [Bermanella marisrubri]|uniref:Flagellar M-ring protein n=1 Tax=Bermanella marisrubri TaxID=207949 RepID=Q1N2X4_9GAMM|nr:flagellar basal-body MS-ring/collar protein FliF [Bermanella marisrubri]EAT12545.1 flagellar M-ring protein [Oceanobacter sp. RED65] [Bermanella marisrubri]QIZ84897.1 flagellar M-ring protein FliF [Bermanella marisrubri]
MAEETLPAESSGEIPAPQEDALQEQNIDNLPQGSDASDINPIMMGFNKLTIVRQVALLIGFAGILALGIGVIIWSQEVTYRPLISNLEDYNAKEILQTLDEKGIDYRINPTTGIVTVPEAEIHDARLALAPIVAEIDTTVGLELLDQEQGLGTSQFIESARYRRGLEGELARTIASLQSVRNARVHLALPKQSVFVRDDREPRASVFLEIYGGKGLKREQAEAIINLIASSIPELPVENVTLVDQKGNLLSKEGQDEEDLLATKQFDYTRKVENSLHQRVQRILEPVLGSDNFQAEVSADVDFTMVEQTQELFNPDLIALRSEQTLNQEKVEKPEGGIPGALSNQPPGAAEVPEEVDENGNPVAQPIERKSEATRNYEVDRTLSHTQHQVGRLRRLTVSVAVNDREKVNPETGVVESVPWTEAELKRLELLVKDSVGFNAARGDSVSVVNSLFLGGAVELGEPDFWKQPWFWEIVKQVLAGLFLLILIFGVIRPIVKNLIDRGKMDEVAEIEGELDELGDGDDLFGDDKVTLAGADEFLLPGASEGFERQLDALKGLIAEDPARVAQSFKKWVNDGK